MEYGTLGTLVRALAPCEMLVFGVGRDTRAWCDANAGGRTVFLWAEKPRSIRSTTTRHSTSRHGGEGATAHRPREQTICRHIFAALNFEVLIDASGIYKAPYETLGNGKLRGR
ncbi:MAG: hypothetical protein KDN22_28530 [Verrucomicrobiae bacterium]|nr:hypothetical protein [Verrucomicrobiae bacterium]